MIQEISHNFSENSLFSSFAVASQASTASPSTVDSANSTPTKMGWDEDADYTVGMYRTSPLVGPKVDFFKEDPELLDMFTSNFQFVSDSSYYLNIFKLVIIIIIVILSLTLFLITFKKTCKSFWSAICRKKTKKSSKIED